MQVIPSTIKKDKQISISLDTELIGKILSVGSLHFQLGIFIAAAEQAAAFSYKISDIRVKYSPNYG